MSNEIRNLEPQVIWNHFEDLNAVPRPSGKEEQVRAFMVEKGAEWNLETKEDQVGNVIIKKPASSGYENKATVILQAHLDMVHQKNADTNFDFSQEGIRSLIQDDWVTADGTTLGADNGMGVAAIMALLSSSDIEHPPLEALFTINEEAGMTGAKEFDPDLLNGTILLNLDTEDDDELSIGCAGGIDSNVRAEYTSEKAGQNLTGYNLYVKGLKGGHSGMEIHLGRANANKVMNRLMVNAYDNFGLRITSINGGSLRNAIPRESFAEVWVDENKAESFVDHIRNVGAEIQSEFSIPEPEMLIGIEPSEPENQLMPKDLQEKMIKAISAVHNGVYTMSASIPGLVETSSSLAKISAKDGVFESQSLQRSSVDSAKFDVADAVGSAFELMGAEVEHAGSYPGWQPNKDSDILKITENIYKEMFDGKPDVKACHAGLECGLLSEKLPKVDMISFGPTIMHPHSPDEKVSISSVQKFWKFLLYTLKQIPDK